MKYADSAEIIDVSAKLSVGNLAGVSKYGFFLNCEQVTFDDPFGFNGSFSGIKPLQYSINQNVRNVNAYFFDELIHIF